MSDIISRLNKLREKDEISIQEIEFARFLYELDGSDIIPVVVGASCLSAHLNGHICVDIEYCYSHKIYGALLKDITKEAVFDSLLSSKLIGNGTELTPLVMEEDRIYLHKFWKYEQELAEWLISKSKETYPLTKEVKNHVGNLFLNDEDSLDWQKIAVYLSLIKDLVIISGGPGTGKTFTIQKIIDALTYSNPEGYSIALAAPTGKAAQRLSESLELEKHEYTEDPVTIHKLLGAKGESGQFLYGEKNPLPFDTVIIDEASMLDITLWIGLIRSISKQTRLILLGDKNQLASVEAGSILGDICFHATNNFSRSIINQVDEAGSIEEKNSSINDSIVLLEKNYRFDETSGIQLLSEAINRGDSDQVLTLLTSEDYPELSMSKPSNEIVENLLNTFAVEPFKNYSSSEDKISFFNEYQILCALRRGPFGVDILTSGSEKEIKRAYSIPDSKLWYHGRAVLMTKNNRVLKVNNGETGICVETEYGPKLQFEGRNQLVDVSRVQHYQPAFAITIHKSQGSEYDHVAIILSNTKNRIFSRQLLYTAVTRARKSVLVIGSTSVISSAVQHSVVRRSGLRDKIWKL